MEQHRNGAAPLHATSPWRVWALLWVTALLVGCADAPYYAQALRGHWAMMAAARPIDDWLREPQGAPALPQRLTLVQSLRRYAVAALHLPDNASYTRYADLQRPFAVWNVVAAPPDSLTPKDWCFPVAGCVGYRGYFDRAAAQALADELQAQGLEVSVYGVPAYSTLGWSNAVGGDPMLSTFINYPDADLARLMFHELAHQVVYVGDDTAFNESFATAVERLGVAQWLAQHGTVPAQQDDVQAQMRRQQFRALIRETRARLMQIYKENSVNAPANKPLLAMKNGVMRDFRASYAQLKLHWRGDARYDAWVAQANNAAFAAQGAYDDWAPAFAALFEQQGRDWRKFYDAVKQLAQRPVPERRQALQALCSGPARCNANL